jgi:uncharacterized protein YecE (DUF72 family)
MILIGTSGYAFSDWVGPFYPAGTLAEEYLSFYSQEFQTTEIGLTGELSTGEALGELLLQVPAGFQFVVHLLPAVTHLRDLSGVPAFVKTIQPLVQANCLGAALAQFPCGFDKQPENQTFLLQLREALDELPLVVEFPHKDWIVEGMENWLREKGIGFVCVDQPRLQDLVQPIAWATGPVACVRFHGRNYQGWEAADPTVRYDYSYDMLDLAEWLPKIEELDAKADLVLVLMNNLVRAQAVEAARAMGRMLLLD